MKDKLLEGPENPENFTISHAFGVTVAAKYIGPPWKEKMAWSGVVEFSDLSFPNPHNVTELTLDEVWGLYGTDVPFSVITNIAPGFPSSYGGKHRKSTFSWGY
jgi:hypothetical protein